MQRLRVTYRHRTSTARPADLTAVKQARAPREFRKFRRSSNAHGSSMMASLPPKKSIRSRRHRRNFVMTIPGVIRQIYGNSFVYLCAVCCVRQPQRTKVAMPRTAQPHRRARPAATPQFYGVFFVRLRTFTSLLCACAAAHKRVHMRCLFSSIPTVMLLRDAHLRELWLWNVHARARHVPCLRAKRTVCRCLNGTLIEYNPATTFVRFHSLWTDLCTLLPIFFWGQSAPSQLECERRVVCDNLCT